MKRQPNPDDPAYRDKKITEEYRKRNNPKKPTEGELLGKKGGYLDTGELDKSGNPLLIEKMDPRMRESYERNKGNPEFNKEMEAFRKGKPNLTDDEILERLKRNKGLLQIGQTVYNTGRLALRIGTGLWQLNKLNRGF